MQSLDSSFSELRQRLRDRSSLRSTGSDPVYYLVFQPREMRRVQQQIAAWEAQLKLDDWQVEILSLADVLREFFENHPLRRFWLQGEIDADISQINETLRNALLTDKTVEKAILAKLEQLAAISDGLLLITDVEALHPYLRIGAIEQRLQDRVAIPTVIFYPGLRKGQSNLSFLGIYPDDGNYRSVHIGG
jgi:hypothetical protein